MIFSLNPEITILLFSWPDTTIPTSSTEAAINHLRREDNVISLSVNSTLGRNFPMAANPVLPLSEQYMTVISGHQRGKALLICMKEGRENWEVQFNDSKFILEEQFGLEVRQ